MLDLAPPSSTPTGFRKTYCMNCTGGFVRTYTNTGNTTLMCLVDREPIQPDIESCNRYEPIPHERRSVV